MLFMFHHTAIDNKSKANWDSVLSIWSVLLLILDQTCLDKNKEHALNHGDAMTNFVDNCK